jgi:hypothetical protein
MRRYGLCVLIACATDPKAADPLDTDTTPEPVETDVPPLELSFTPWSPPTVPLRLGLGRMGETLYTATVRGLEASDDLGQTWELRGPVSSLTVTRDALFDLNGVELRRSTDGRSFEVLTPPLPSADIQRIHLDGEGDLWLLSRANPPLVFRSPDLGDTFEPVAVPPDTTTLTPCEAAGGVMTAVRSYAEVVQWRDGGWVTLGPAENPSACFVTAAGTVLVAARDTESVELRWPEGALAWERQPSPGYALWRQLERDVARVLTAGRVDRSDDDGATWVTQAAAPGGVFGIGALEAVGDTLVALSGPSVARLAPDSAAWSLDASPGLPSYLRVVDLSFAANGQSALLLLENISHVLYVTDASGAWWQGLGFDQGAARAIALSPDGERVFVGGSYGSFQIISDRGRAVQRTGRINDLIGNQEQGRVTGAAWGEDVEGNSFVVVSTADDNDTAGAIWVGGDADDFGTWRNITPYRTATSPGLRLGGWYALALGRRAPPVGEALFAGMRSFVSSASYTHQLLYKPELFDTNGEWFEAAPPVAYAAPIAGAWRDAYLGGLATLWPDNQLYYGIGAGLQQRVPIDMIPAAASVVRVDPAGVMWLGTDGGLWRSTAPLP